MTALPEPSCCEKHRTEWRLSQRRIERSFMICCDECGSKRCARAQDCSKACSTTNTNWPEYAAMLRRERDEWRLTADRWAQRYASGELASDAVRSAEHRIAEIRAEMEALREECKSAKQRAERLALTLAEIAGLANDETDD